jgi:hypothetical protein
MDSDRQEQPDGQITWPGCGRFRHRLRNEIRPTAVIACDKREAFAQGRVSAEAIHTAPIDLWIASLALAMTMARGTKTE